MIDVPGARRGNPIRIALISGYLGGGGGAERQITELAAHLDRSRFEPTVVALVPDSMRSKHGGTYYQRLERSGVPIVTLPRSRRAGPVQLLRLAGWLRRERPDIAHSFLFSENWRTRLAALAAPSVRVISGERSINAWKRSHHHALERLLARRASRIVVNAEAIRTFLIEDGGLPAAKIQLIYNGVDTDHFSPLADRPAARRARGWPDGAFVVGHTGTMVEHKGQRRVLEACAAARVAGLRVLLIGDGPDRPELLRLARELGLADRLEMPGFVGDVREALGCLDAYVHFSREREGCSNAILEAMACGLPVIATDVGGNRELIRHGVTGLIVPEEDVDAVAGNLARLAGDPAERFRLGRGALEVARSRFAVRTMVAATESLYEAVCAQPGS
jgi:glycosyltransferase involved in cell wall biosynthesis